MGFLALSRRALRDLEDIERYTTERWGKSVALEYLDTVQHALRLLESDPGLLASRPEFSNHLRLYRVEKHFLICAADGPNVYVLAVRHGAMDLPSRVAELEPTLEKEVAILHQAYLGGTRTPDK